MAPVIFGLPIMLTLVNMVVCLWGVGAAARGREGAKDGVSIVSIKYAFKFEANAFLYELKTQFVLQDSDCVCSIVDHQLRSPLHDAVRDEFHRG